MNAGGFFYNNKNRNRMYFIYPDATLIERVQLLKNTCVKKEMRNYSRSLQDSEVEQEEKRLASDMMEQKDLEAQLDNIKKDYAAKLKNIEARMDERLDKIKHRKVTISGELFGIANHANMRMMWYDQFGELIDSRDLLPDERQIRMFVEGGPANQEVQDLPLETAQGVKDMTNKEPEGKTVDGTAEVISDTPVQAPTPDALQSQVVETEEEKKERAKKQKDNANKNRNGKK